jgi:hypothetical protein
LGDKSAVLDQWSPQTIEQSAQTHNENNFGDRFKLQKALIAAVDEKNASMAGVMKLVEASRAKMLEFAKKQQNITTLLHADATAGGLVGSARNLRNEVPATQQLLSSTMNKQLQLLQKDAMALKGVVQAAESEYRQRIKAMADTVSSMIAQQDAAFARLSAQQSRAMAASSQALKTSALKDVGSIRSDISSSAKTALTVASQARSGIQTSYVALGDVEDSLGAMESQYSDALQATNNDVQSSVNQQTDKSNAVLDKAADSASVSIQTSAMSVGSDMSRQLDRLDHTASKIVGDMVANTTKVTASIEKSASKTESSTQSALNQAVNDVTKKVDNIDAKSQLLTSDQLTVSQDMKATLDKQQAVSSSAGSGFSTDLAKLLGVVNGQIGGVTSQGKSVSQDVLSGTSDEAVRLSKALNYLLNQASSGTSGLSEGAQAQLAAQQKAQAELLAQREAQIGGAGDQLNSAMADASKAALRGAGGYSDRVNGMSSTFGASIGGLLSSLGDASGSAKEGLNQITGALGGQVGDSMSAIMEALKAANNGATDSEENFLNSIVGPSRDGSAKSMSQVQALLAALSGQLGGQSDGQQSTLDALRAFQSDSSKQLKGASGTLAALQALSGQMGEQVGASGTKALADGRAKMVSALLAQMNAAKNQSSDGLARIDQLVNSLISGGVTDNLASVGQTFAVAGASIDSSSQNFVNVERDQIKSLSGLSSMAASLLGDAKNAGLNQKAETEASLTHARANIVAKFKEMAANTTGTDIGKVMQELAKQGNETAIVNFLLGDVQSALQRINQDTIAARDTSDKKRAEFEAYVAETQAELQKTQAAIITQFQVTLSEVQKALLDKRDLIQGSQADMTKSLNDIKAKVEKAQETLGQNLQLYQEKLDGIINEIKSYMNLAADADELAIQKDIAKQLSKVDATEVAIASANAAVNEKISQKGRATSDTGSSTLSVVGGVIDGAIETESSVSDAHLSQADKLLAVASNVDASATELDQSVKSASAMMENGITDASGIASRAITAGEADQAKNVGQLSDQSADVASASRKSFISNLERMGGVDDDTMRVSKQLQSLLGSADGTITDVSESSMAHLDLSKETVTRLNSAEVRKVASVSDVMEAFSAVVLGFLNETSSTMGTVMNELNAVDAASRAKLKQIDTRSKDELNWVGSSLNGTSDAFSQVMDQERIMQSGLKKQLLEDETQFKASEAGKASEIDDIQDQVGTLRQKVNQGQSDHLSRVRTWINSRNPQVGAALFHRAESFLESRSRDAVIRDINIRMQRIKDDISRMTEAKAGESLNNSW